MESYKVFRMLSILSFIDTMPADFIETILLDRGEEERILKYRYDEANNAYNLLEKWGDYAWKCLDMRISHRSMIVSLLLTYRSIDNITINECHDFKLSTYQESWNCFILKKSKFFDKVFMEKGLSFEVANTISQKCLEIKEDEFKSIMRKKMAKYI